MQSNKYTPQDLRDIIQVFRDFSKTEDDPHPHDYQILTYAKSDYQGVQQIISKYTRYRENDFMWSYILDVLFIIKYESLPLWVNQGPLIEELASWRIKYGS